MTQSATPARTRDELVDLFRTVNTTVLYDVFAEALSSVLARYGAGVNSAGSDAERGLWTERIVALRNYQDAIGPDDRDAMIDGIVLLQAERRQFEASAAQSVA